MPFGPRQLDSAAAASHSPLAQPWSIIGGNTIAAFVGVFTWMWLKDPIAASGIAVGASIGGG